MKNNDLSKSNHENGRTEPEVCIYRTVYHEMSLKLVLMNPNQHIKLMHSWANRIYAFKYWKMEGNFKDFQMHYEEKLLENREIFLIAYLDNLPVAQIEIYLVKDSVLNQYLKPGHADYCFRFLMAPRKELLLKWGDKSKGISKTVVQATLEYLFYNSMAENIVVEPDKDNKHACILAERTGFKFRKYVKLPDKTAALYQYKRKEFLKKYPQPIPNNKYNLFADRHKR